MGEVPAVAVTTPAADPVAWAGRWCGAAAPQARSRVELRDAWWPQLTA
ncbi:hypothetical protein [Dactylosporangium sp. NPDC000521]